MQTRSGKQILEQQLESRQVLVCINDHVDNLSCPGSHVSSSKPSLSRVTSAKSSLLRAQLKEKQLREELELEKKLLKARHDVEMAELLVKLAVDDKRKIGNTKRDTVNYARISEESIKDDIRRPYEAEFRDTEESEHSFSIEDPKAIELVTQSTVLEKGHYIISLPWKDPAKVTDNNYVVAINRLLSLKWRLSRDKNLSARYVDGINAMLKNGYALPVPLEQLAANYRPRWYLPHHPVKKPKKPDKLRIVLDCAATFRGYSLNDKLYEGPDTITELVGVLLRFREKPIAVVADIADMFMQVKVPLIDRRALLFLWWKNGFLDEEPQEFQMTASVRVNFITLLCELRVEKGSRGLWLLISGNSKRAGHEGYTV
ncbi:unnamed protein product [Trichobilharzia szidati]|nr:unnamed protein product [Trichobilharzia szidati]CAH8874917.1 unnamed protein product [Trichobilharzia szidati]